MLLNNGIPNNGVPGGIADERQVESFVVLT